MSVKGAKRIVNNYRLKVKEISEQRTQTAVRAVLLEGSAMAATMVPMDTGHLLQSQYAPQVITHTGKTVGHVGFTAQYALWVHEMPGKLKGQPRADFGTTRARESFGGGSGRGFYWDPDAEPQFMVKGFDQINPMQIIEAIYRVK